MEQSTLDKMNESIALALINDDAKDITVFCFDQIAKFTAAHQTVEASEFHAHKREEILHLFIEDMHRKIFRPNDKKKLSMKKE